MAVWNPENFFAASPLFRQIPAQRLKDFAWKSRKLPFDKGAFIFQEGEPADAAWWVAEGFVKIAKATPQGRMLTMEMLVPGDIFGPAGLMKLDRYPANALAVTKASVVRVFAADLAALVQEFPTLPQDVLGQVSLRLQRARRLRALEAQPADKKVAAALLWLQEKIGDTFNISRREISEIAGIAPETAIRMVLFFKKKKWLSAKARSFTILQPAALQSFIDRE
jgi:CRP/FNR family transcriptional regulator, cyclic AMP receptor protein